MTAPAIEHTQERPHRSRLTERDDDYTRLHSQTIRKLNLSLRQLTRDIKAGDQSAALSAFIARHSDLLRDAYVRAHGEGAIDYYGEVSQEPKTWAAHTQPQSDRMRSALQFYAPSVAKMAHEALLAYQKPTASTARLDEQDLANWQNGVDTRIGLQAEIVWVALNDGYTDAGGKDVAIPWLGLYWILGLVKTMHCADCPEIAAGSPYDPPGTPGGKTIYQSPGDGQTRCGAGCKCWLEYGLPSVSLPKNYVYDGMNLPGPGAAPVVARGAADVAEHRARAEANYSWREAQLLSPESEMLSGGQKLALDLFRAKWQAWEDVRGELPPLPDMFALEEQAQEIPDLEAYWGQMSEKQRQTLIGIQEAISSWNAATREASDGAGDDIADSE